MYLVARTKENGSYVQRLHALDIATGASRPGSPVTIAATVPGNAPDSTSDRRPVITFDPKMQAQRAGLALVNGVVLIAWAGHEDLPPYHGWIWPSTRRRSRRSAHSRDARTSTAAACGRAAARPAIDAAATSTSPPETASGTARATSADSLLKFRGRTPAG